MGIKNNDKIGDVIVVIGRLKIACRRCGWEPGQRTSRNDRACVSAGTMWSTSRPERLWPADMVEADAGTNLLFF